MGHCPGKDKPMLYRTCKRMIERGNLEGMSTKPVSYTHLTLPTN